MVEHEKISELKEIAHKIAEYQSKIFLLRNRASRCGLEEGQACALEAYIMINNTIRKILDLLTELNKLTNQEIKAL